MSSGTSLALFQHLHHSRDGVQANSNSACGGFVVFGLEKEHSGNLFEIIGQLMSMPAYIVERPPRDWAQEEMLHCIH